MDGLWIVLAVALATSAGYTRLMERRKAARRALPPVPGTRIAGVRDGERVRLAGRVEACEPLRTSPISQRRCIGFRLTVEYRDSLTNWYPIIDETAFDSLLLADDTGKAVLHPPFDVRLDPYRETSVVAASPALASLLASRGLPHIDVFVTGREFRYAETVLVPGAAIVAIGRATLEIDPAGHSASHRDPPMACHLKGSDEAVIIAAGGADSGPGES